MRSRSPVVALALAGALAGCEGASSREYTVTLTEPAEIECEGNQAAILSESQIKALARQARDARRFFAQSALSTPRNPIARRLQVNQREGEMTSWFENLDVSQSSLGFGPGEVHVGHPEEEIVEGRYERIRNDVVVEDDTPSVVCARVEVISLLAATLVDDMVDGRVRRVERFYIGPSCSCGDGICEPQCEESEDTCPVDCLLSTATPCDLWYECARNIELVGVERE